MCATIGDVNLPKSSGPGSGGTGGIWSEGSELPSLPAPTLLEGPPSVEPAPSIPIWCSGANGQVLDAAQENGCLSKACPVGQRPKSLVPSECEDIAGPAWTCPPGFVVSGSSCAPDPADCTSAWGGVLPGTNVFFVSASSLIGGDGSQDKPFQTIGEAISAIPSSGGTIAIGAGTYSGGITLDKPISLVGACASQVILKGDGTSATVVLASSGSSVTRVSVTGGVVGVRGEGKISSSIDRAWIHDNSTAGVHIVSGANVSLSRSFIANTLANSTGGLGNGILVEGATLLVQDVRLSFNRHSGLYATTGSSITGSGLWIDSTQFQDSNGDFGFGIFFADKVNFALENLRISGNRGHGVHLEGGPSGNGSNWWIDGTLSAKDKTGGVGLTLLTAKLQVDGLRLSGNLTHSVWLTNPDTTATLRNVSIEGTGPQASDQQEGQGILLEGAGVTLDLTAAHVVGSHAAGVQLAGTGAIGKMKGVLIEKTEPKQSDLSSGRGLNVLQGATLQIPTNGVVQIAGSFTQGFWLSGVGTTWIGGSIRVQNTQSSKQDGKDGQGGVIEDGAQMGSASLEVSGSQSNGIFVSGAGTKVVTSVLSAKLTTTRSSDNTQGGGILVADGAQVQARISAIGSVAYGVQVDGKTTRLDAVPGSNSPAMLIGFTAARPTDETGGIGLQISGGGTVISGPIRIQNSYDHGIFLYGPGCSIKAGRVLVSQTAIAADNEWGRGIGVYADATATFSDVRIEGSHDVGLFVTSPHVNIDDLTIDGGTRGIEVDGGGVLSGHRWRIQSASEVAIFVANFASTLRITDLALHSVGFGIHVKDFADVTIDRAAMVSVRGVAALVDGGDLLGNSSHLRVMNTRISDVTSVKDKDGKILIPGNVFASQARAGLQISGVTVHDWSGIGLLATSASAEVGGFWLHDGSGTGIRAVGSTVSIAGSRIQASSGVAFSASASSANLSESAFQVTQSSGGISDGFEIVDLANVNASRVVVSGMGIGILLGNGTIQANRLRVSGNAIGLGRGLGGSETWSNSAVVDNFAGNQVSVELFKPISQPSETTPLDLSTIP